MESPVSIVAHPLASQQLERFLEINEIADVRELEPDNRKRIRRH